MNHRPLVIHKINPAGLAMGIVAQKMVGGLVKEALKRIHAQFKQRTLIDVAGTVDQHMAGGFGQVGRLVVFQPVGLDDHVALAQHGTTFNHGFQVWASSDALTRDKSGQAAAHFRADLFLQQRAGLQQQWGSVWHLSTGQGCLKKSHRQKHRRQRKTARHCLQRCSTHQGTLFNHAHRAQAKEDRWRG